MPPEVTVWQARHPFTSDWRVGAADLPRRPAGHEPGRGSAAVSASLGEITRFGQGASAMQRVMVVSGPGSALADEAPTRRAGRGSSRSARDRHPGPAILGAPRRDDPLINLPFRRGEPGTTGSGSRSWTGTAAAAADDRESCRHLRRADFPARAAIPENGAGSPRSGSAALARSATAASTRPWGPVGGQARIITGVQASRRERPQGLLRRCRS